MSTSEDIQEAISNASRILILQADNPDGDSLASALALEQILGDMGKEPFLYCGVEMPTYLRYLEGWDRVSRDIPGKFDLSIIVDTSALSLFENLQKTNQYQWVASKPCIVIDHHDVELTIPFATINHNEKAVATGELIYELAAKHGWPLNDTTNKMLAVSILSDSLGLMSEGTTARSIHIIGELVEKGVSLAELESLRRETQRKKPELIRYKGELLQRVEYFAGDRIATVTIPWAEIEKYSYAYNPSMLVIEDMRLSENTDIAIAFKIYKDNKVTAKIRCNFGVTIANKVAEHFGGGGHPYASGFKVTDGRSFNEIKSECIRITTELLDTLKAEKDHETIQHSN
jgi:phosphoesterase RecJ-like protein